ncbi:hypothetical protein [Flavobacterium sp.]
MIKVYYFLVLLALSVIFAVNSSMYHLVVITVAINGAIMVVNGSFVYIIKKAHNLVSAFKIGPF